jgi:hypothetical protein
MRKTQRWAAWLATVLSIAAVGGAQAQADIYTFTTIEPPGATTAAAQGITSSGLIVGSYVDSSGLEHGFLYNNGSFTNIDFPTGSPATTNTLSLGINPGGISTTYSIVGIYNVSGTPGGGYLDNSGTISAFNDPSAVNGSTRPTGVNDSGAIVGSYSDGTNSHGFVNNGGTFTDINVTGATNTFALGINNSGAIVGYYTTGSSSNLGFVDNNGTFTTLDPLNSTFTRATGINSAGDIVGFYSDGTNNHGYLYDPITMSYTFFDYPGAPNTVAQGINASSQIVGYYENSNGGNSGFLATPQATTVPEPSSAVLALVVGLAGLGLAWRNRGGARPVTARQDG